MPPTLHASLGWSAKSDAGRAGREAAEQALSQPSSARPQLALVFASSWFDQELLLGAVRSVTGQVPIAGGSTAGEITPEGPASHSCLVLLLSAGEAMCSIGAGEGVDRQPRDAGHQAAFAAARDFRAGPRSGFLLFGDGLVTNYADAVRGIQEVVGTSTVIVGGMTGDDSQFARTYQYFNDRALSRSIVGVLFGGPVKLGVGLEHGFAPISKPRRITRARANILYELDRKPATSVYEEYFGTEVVRQMRGEGLTRQRIAYPLGIQYGTGDRWLLRNVVAFGEDGSLACSGEMLEGSWLQLMIGSKELALEAAARAAQQAIQSVNYVACVLIADSVVRRRLLGDHYAALEVARIRDVVGHEVPLAGWYSYGEQAPVRSEAVYERIATQTGSVLVIALGA